MKCMRLMRRATEEHLTNGVLARLAASPQATAQPISGVTDPYTASDWLPTNDEISAFYHLVIARRASPAFQSHDVVLESHDHDASTLASHINACKFSLRVPPSLPSPHISLQHNLFLHPVYHFSMSDKGRQSFTDKAGAALKVLPTRPQCQAVSLTPSPPFSPTLRSLPPSTLETR